MRRGSQIFDAVQRFFGTGGFPLFSLCFLFFYELLLIGLLLAPGGPSGLGAFADDFRVWCFGYDPATGHLQWSFVLSMMGPPVMLGAMLALLWWEPLRGALVRPATVSRHALAAAASVAAVAAGFVFLGAEPAQGELPFPAEGLRTAHKPPQLRLVNQRGEPVDLAALRGQVVILTAVYASCPHTCPQILAQAKRAIASLSDEERESLRIVAVTLDPAKDTPEALADLATRHGLDAPLYNLVTGEPSEVEAVLDSMGIARERDPQTGMIDHANLFLLLDRGGRIAYRLTLGDRQERWLASALRVLVKEGDHAS